MRPALALLEFQSIALGIQAGDAMVKRAPLEVTYAGTVQPGKYLVLVAGDVASVEEAIRAGRETAGSSLVDLIFLPDIHPEVVDAVAGARRRSGGEAAGVVETRTVAATIGAADRGIKGAEVSLLEVRMADGLGGKAYCVFAGPVRDVEVAVDLAVGGLSRPDLLVAQVVIPQFHVEMLENLERAPEFGSRVRSYRGEA